MAQITIERLSFRYPDEGKNAIEEVSLKIEDGSFVILFGKSGCGKSTLLRNLKPLIRPHGHRTGTVYFNEQKIEEMSEREQAARIGFVMQNPNYQIVTDKVWHELAFGLENLGYQSEEIRVRVCEIAEYFGIADWFDLSVETLSGGQKQILNLAATMVMNPEVLILDEPTAQLDPIAAERFFEILKKLHRDFGITVIMSEHRMSEILDWADQLIMMDRGMIRFCTEPGKIIDTESATELMKLFPYPVQIYYAVSNSERWIRWQKEYAGDSKNKIKPDRCPLSVRDGKNWLKMLMNAGYIPGDKNNKDYKGIGNSGNRHQNNESGSAIECKNISFRYEKKAKDVLKNLFMEIKRGEIFALLGGNGTGKTTLFSLLTGINRAYHGKIRIYGRIAYLPQDVQTMFCYDSVEKELKDVSGEIISLMQLEPLMKRHPYDLSGGEQQKLGLAKVLKEDPDILLLDEPTKAIDGIYKETMGELLKTLKEQGKTIVFASHDIDFCGEYADRCGLIAQGEIVRVDYVRDFFAQSNFYTTTVHRMAGDVFENAVKKEDVLCYLTDGNIT